MAKTDETEAQAAQIEQLIQSDPTLMQLRAQAQQLKARPGKTGKGDPAFAGAIRDINLQIGQRLEQLGVPIPQDYAINIQKGDVDYQNWLERNWQKVVVAGILGAATWGIASAAAGAPAVAGSGSAAAGGGAAAGTAAGAGAGVGTAVAASTPLWKDLLKVGIPVGAQIGADIYNTKTQADANKAAVDAQAKAAADALAFTKEQYADLQRRRAPFEAASLGSLTELYKRMGLGDLPSQTRVDPNAPGNPTGNATLNPSPITPTPTPYINLPTSGTTPVGNNQGPPVMDAQGNRLYVPQNPTSLSSLNRGQTNQTATVRVRTPKGNVIDIPAAEVTQAVAAGGVLA